MEIINLPVIGEQRPVADAIQAMRHRRTGGVVSVSRSRFRLHTFKELIAAARYDSAQPLGQIPGWDVDELELTDAQSYNLSFTRPNIGMVDSYLGVRQKDFLLMAAAPGQPGTALIAFKSGADAQYYGVYPKAWVCPQNSNEVWDDSNKPTLCPNHGVAPVEDK
jgi:hypothetical protein